MTHLLDTGTCFDLLRGDEGTIANAAPHPPDALAISAITEYELFYGARRCPPDWQERESGKIALLLQQLHILSFTSKEAVEAAEIRAHLGRAGQPIGPMDLLIAATATVAELTLVTNNLREFQRIPSLRTISWR